MPNVAALATEHKTPRPGPHLDEEGVLIGLHAHDGPDVVDVPLHEVAAVAPVYR